MKNISKYRITMVKEESFRYDYEGTSPENVANLLCDMGYDMMPQELVGVVACNNKGRVIGIFEISQGSINSAMVPMPSIFQRLLLCNAESFVMWHNHPSGDCNPSAEDITTAERVSKCAKLMGIRFFDSIIIGDGKYYSMAENGVLE